MGIQIKKFQAPTIQKAIEQVRTEMGDNAIILQTEPLRDASRFGIFSRNAVEVTAAIDRKELPPRFHATVSEDGPKTAATPSGEDSAKAAKVKQLLKIFGTSEKKTDSAERNLTSGSQKETTAPTRASLYDKSSEPNSGSSSSISQLYAVKTFVEPLQKELEELKTQMKSQSGSSSFGTTTPKRKLKDPLQLEVQQLREELSNFIHEKRFENSGLPLYYRQLLTFWSEKGMSQKQILQFFREIEEWGTNFDESSANEDVVQAVNHVLAGRINEAKVLDKPISRIVVLVGPTGVGKTTTIAKMAAHEKLRQGKKVALMTADDYKIGGMDQISHYARILEVPFVKMRADRSLEEQCQLIQADTIFVDTFGVSAFDENRLQELRRLLKFTDPEMKARLEVHLVLPVSIATPDVTTWMEKFNDLDPQFLIFTKWDETQNWGGMLAAILAIRKPVSFICHGQEVPDAMSVFSKKNFIETVTAFYSEEGV